MSVVAPEVLRERAERYAADNPGASLAEVLGRFRLSPEDEGDERALVESVLAGEGEHADVARGAADDREVTA